jgi:serine/threonine-protein kinase ULK/ATG1
MVDLINNIKNKPLNFPKNVNKISEVTEDMIRRMLVVDPKKRIEWENVFVHPITYYLED